MLIIVYRTTKSQGKIRKISPVILLSAEEYRNPFSLQGKDMLLALFFLLYALLCGAFRISFCNQLKAALPCRNCVPYPISLQLNYVHPHRLFMAVCSFFTHSMCQMSHSERQIVPIYRMILWKIAHFFFALFHIVTLCNLPFTCKKCTLYILSPCK